MASTGLIWRFNVPLTEIRLLSNVRWTFIVQRMKLHSRRNLHSAKLDTHQIPCICQYVSFIDASGWGLAAVNIVWPPLPPNITCLGYKRKFGDSLKGTRAWNSLIYCITRYQAAFEVLGWAIINNVSKMCSVPRCLVVLNENVRWVAFCGSLYIHKCYLFKTDNFGIHKGSSVSSHRTFRS